jgi:hypothetical protein
MKEKERERKKEIKEGSPLPEAVSYFSRTIDLVFLCIVLSPFACSPLAEGMNLLYIAT